MRLMSIRDLVLSEIRIVAAEQGKAPAPLSDDLPLLESGLDSLCFAILVSRLEDATGRDPFAAAKASDFPRTVGELVAFYEPAHV
jgi:acyl carrier protein